MTHALMNAVPAMFFGTRLHGEAVPVGVVWFQYAMFVLLASVLIRASLHLLKAWAIRDGELDDAWSGGGDPPSGWGFRRQYATAMMGLNARGWACEYWTIAVLCAAEVAIYPFLIAADAWILIGVWLALKMAGEWRQLRDSRTAFSRFMLGNIMTLIASLALVNWLSGVAIRAF